MRKLLLAFPGQGSQYEGMGRSCFSDLRLKSIMEEASEAIGCNVKDLCMGNIPGLHQTEYCQPAILTVSYAMYRLFFLETGVMTSMMCGHSLGEYTALVCSGALKFSDALKLVRLRGLLMKESIETARVEWSMVAINGINVREIESMVKGKEGSVEISAYNNETQCSLSGLTKAVLPVQESLVHRGAVVTPLKVSAPFHSSLLKGMSSAFSIELSNCSFRTPRLPVLANVDAVPYQHANELVAKLSQQISKPVQWKRMMDRAVSGMNTLMLEVGPGRVLSRLADGRIKAFAMDRPESYKDFLELIHKGEEVYGPIHKCLALAVSTPNCDDNASTHVAISGMIKSLKEVINRYNLEKRAPNRTEIGQAIKTLKLIFIAKKISREEMEQRMELLSEFN